MDGTRAQREVAAFRALASELRGRLEQRAILERVVHHAREVLGCAAVRVSLLNPEQTALLLELGDGMATPHELPLTGGSPAARALGLDTTVLDNEYGNNPHALPAMRALGFVAVLVTPLREGNRPVGVLAAGHTDPGQRFSAEDVQTLETFAWLAEMAMAGSERIVDAVRRAARREVLHDLIQEQAVEQDPKVLARHAGEATLRLFAADRGALWLRGADGAQSFLWSHRVSAAHLRTLEREPLRGERPVFVRDVLESRQSPLRDDAEREGFRAVLWVPLLVRQSTIGALVLYHDVPWSYSDEDLLLATTIGHQLGATITSLSLLAELRQQVERLDTLAALGRAGVETSTAQARCDRAARALVHRGGLDAISIYVMDPDGSVARNLTRHPAEELPGIPSFAMSEDSMTARAVRGLRTVTTYDPDVPAISRRRLEASGYFHGAAVPLVHHGKPVGVMLAVRRTRPLSKADLEFLAIAADQIAVLVESASPPAAIGELTLVQRSG